MTRQTAEVINTVTNSKLELNEGEESIDMCKAIEDMRNEAIQEGEAKGRAEGEAKGRAEGEAKGIAEGLKQALEKLIASGMDEATAKTILGLA